MSNTPPVNPLEPNRPVPSEAAICAQCHRDPPDGREQLRQLDGGESLWLHAECEDAYLQRRLAEEGLAGGTNGQGNGHAEPAAEAPEAAPAEEPDDSSMLTPTGAALEPNLADINAHLYAIFPPDFVKHYPDAWIEIASANPNAGEGKTGVRAGKPFSVFKLEEAAAYAVRMNKQGRNVYVGMALRTGSTGPSGRATKANVVTGSRGWADFDKEGDDVRIKDALKQKGLQAAELVLTGTIPHIRFQIFFRLTGKPEGGEPVTPEQLEAVNAAMRDHLGGNGDGVQNCDRVMRLAGTVSYPPPKKVARGYVPELTKLVALAPVRPYRPNELILMLEGNPTFRMGPERTAAAAKATAAKTTAAKTTAAATATIRDDSGDKTFWRKVNELALANLSSWVPELFGDDAKFQKGTNAYRVTSKNLKRELEEDLSIHPKGITDWGLDDQGEDKGDKIGRRTAIDLVIEYGGAADAKQAALWLCEKCGVDPKTLGWKDKKGSGAGNPEIERLAQLSRVDYEKTRKAEAKKLGLRVSVLDDLVAQTRVEGDEGEAVDEVAQINKDHALVLAGNKAAVMKFDEPTKFRLLQTSAFTTWYGNQLIRLGDKMVGLGEYWLKHAERRQYAGIEFAPPGAALHPNFYNLWQGFTCEPVKGDCSKFLAHLKSNAANGDEATFLWQFGWWAQVFQHPSIKTGTSLVLRGGFGAGKTKIGEVFGSLLGDHYQPVSRSGHITGQFNSHMAALLLLHADEAFWAGSKEAVGVLRDLVTGSQHLLEYKGVDKIRIRNFIRLFVTGNPDWMVPAGFKERRWAIFDIGEDKMQDGAYFAAIDEEMNNGGREALLWELLNFDLSQVNLRVVPKTAALLDQQIESMDAEQAWWFEMLMRGGLPSRPEGVAEANVCLKDDLYQTYILHSRIQGIHRRSIGTKIGMFLSKQLGAKLTHPRPYVGKQQLNCYRLPPLQECREEFDKKLGQPVDWGSGQEDWRQSDDWKDLWKKFTKNEGSFFN